MSEHGQDQKARTGMTPEETELWIELMEKGLAIQHAVLESKVVLDKLPSELRMDGMRSIRCTRESLRRHSLTTPPCSGRESSAVTMRSPKR